MKHPMAPNVILFDFDGTLADTFRMGLERVNAHADRYGYRKVEENDIAEFRRLRVWQVAARLGIRAWTIPRIARRVRKEMRERMHEAPVFPGVTDMLAGLRTRGVQVGIVSSNHHRNIDNFLKAHDLARFFDFVAADRSIFGKWKCLKKALKVHQIQASRAVLVGDELRDLEAAWRNGVAFLPVSWGLNDPATLSLESGVPALERPADLWNRLQEWPHKAPLP